MRLREENRMYYHLIPSRELKVSLDILFTSAISPQTLAKFSLFMKDNLQGAILKVSEDIKMLLTK